MIVAPVKFTHFPPHWHEFKEVRLIFYDLEPLQNQKTLINLSVRSDERNFSINPGSALVLGGRGDSCGKEYER